MWQIIGIIAVAVASVVAPIIFGSQSPPAQQAEGGNPAAKTGDLLAQGNLEYAALILGIIASAAMVYSIFRGKSP